MAASRHRLALMVTAIAAACAASLLLPATTLAQATDPDPEDPKTKGWRIFTEAREAAGAGPDGGMAQVEEFYANFQDVGGYRWPFYKKVVRNGKTATESITLDMQVNVGLTERNIMR